MEQFLQQIASGLANGAIYACVALALVMIYVSTDHINFAQGELAMFSTYISWQLMSWGAEFWVAFAAAVVFSFVMGVVIERVILRPLHNAPVLSIVVVFIGLLAICNSMAGAIWSYLIKEYPSPFPKSSFGIAGVIGPHQLGVVLVTLHLQYGELARLPRTASPGAQQRRLPAAGRSRDDRHFLRRRAIQSGEKITPVDQPASCPGHGQKGLPWYLRLTPPSPVTQSRHPLSR